MSDTTPLAWVPKKLDELAERMQVEHDARIGLGARVSIQEQQSIHIITTLAEIKLAQATELKAINQAIGGIKAAKWFIAIGSGSGIVSVITVAIKLLGGG